jgi:hypothetical protein
MSDSLLTLLPGSPVLHRSISRASTPPLPFLRQGSKPVLLQLPKSTVYIFVKGLIKYTLLDSTAIQYIYQHPGCIYTKVVEKVESTSTGNFICYYQSRYKGILLSKAEERTSKVAGKQKEFFTLFATKSSLQEGFRKDLYNIVAANNLPICFVESVLFYKIIQRLNL